MSSTAALAPSGIARQSSPEKGKAKALPPASSDDTTATKDASPPAAGTGAGTGAVNAKNVASPGELCGFVDTLLNQLESRFDDMSEQVLARMNEMSGRIDNLETAISDLMQDSRDGPTTAGKA